MNAFLDQLVLVEQYTLIIFFLVLTLPFLLCLIVIRRQRRHHTGHYSGSKSLFQPHQSLLILQLPTQIDSDASVQAQLYSPPPPGRESSQFLAGLTTSFFRPPSTAGNPRYLPNHGSVRTPPSPHFGRTPQTITTVNPRLAKCFCVRLVSGFFHVFETQLVER